MPLKPNALSPSIAITGLPVVTAAATAKPMPMPMMPQVPTSRRLRGSYMSTMLRAKSSVLAPSLTTIASGRALTTSRITLSALWKFIGDGFLRQRLGHLRQVLVLALGDRAGPVGRRLRPSSRRCRRAAPTRRSRCRRSAARRSRTLLSISVGEMSIWMNCFGPCRAPGLALAVRQQPVQARADQQHHVGFRQHVRARGRGRLRMRVGQQALGHRHRQVGDAGLLDQRADVGVGLRIGGALAEQDQRALGALAAGRARA